jgi:dTDP-4-amino-4,6-dideoxygalactose transaminase
MKIPFSDLNAQHKEINSQIDKAIKNVIKRSDFILGEDVGCFEEEFALFCHASYAVGVSSGTEALFLALLSLNIGPGDEVIVPDFTYIATSLAVSYTGARPVFVDIEEDTYNIDINEVKKAISSNTKAIIPVHLYGQPANMPEILKIAKENNLKVIEDAAQAHGASIKMPDGKWQVVGGLGDVGCFSFYPSKNLGALGDGGMVVTNNEEIYKRLLMLRDYGRISKYEHSIIGYNARLDTLQAAILRIKLKKLNSWNKMRQKAANIYNRLLNDVEGVITPYLAPWAEHIYHVYAIRAKSRDALLNRLKDNGVGALIHYPVPLHLQKAYENLGYKRGDFPVSEKIAQEIISLPMYPHIKVAQIKFVAKIIQETLRK